MTSQQLVDALQNNTIIIPPEYREIFQALCDVINTNAGGGGTTPLVYRALLTQSGTNAPVATVLENTLGGNIVWSYSEIGYYIGTLAGAFTNDKTYIAAMATATLSDPATTIHQFCYRSSINDIILITGDSNGPNDSILNTSSLEILVYP